VVKDICIL